MGNPPLDGTSEAISHKIDVEVVVCVFLQLHKVVGDGLLDGFLKIEQEIVVLVGTKDVAVNVTVFIEILAELIKAFSSGRRVKGMVLHEFRLENIFQ